MAIILVGRKGDKRQIRWYVVIAIGIAAIAIGGLVGGGASYLLSGRWSHIPIIIITPIIIVRAYLDIANGLRMPIDKLPELK